MRLPLLLLCLILLVPGCGLGEQDRPVLVDTWPAQGATVDGPIRLIRCTYDDPVRILNPFDVRLFIGGLLTAANVFQNADEPHSIYIEPVAGGIWPVAANYGVNLIQGAVVNTQDHYSPVIFAFDFNVAPALTVPVCRGPDVTLFDVADQITDGGTPTPGGLNAIAALRTQESDDQRIWVQLENGGGTGAALAHYAPFEGAMNPITLTTSGGDLTAIQGAIDLGPNGQYVYAAFRDETAGQVRLARVDVDTQVEDGSILLESIPTGASTRPAGLTIHQTIDQLYVTAEDGATGSIAYIDLDTFTEADQDDETPGIQGATLDAGAGPLFQGGDALTVSPNGSLDVTNVRLSTGLVETDTSSTVVGTAIDILRTPDAIVAMQPLIGFDGKLGLQRRTIGTTYTDPVALEISDDVGGVEAGITDAVAMSRITGIAGYILLLDSPSGLIMTLWTQSGATMEQFDLDEGLDGIQAANVEALLSGATSIGLVYGESEP